MILRLYFNKFDKLGLPWQIDTGYGTQAQNYAHVELMSFGVTVIRQNQSPTAWLEFDAQVIEDGAGGAIISA